MKNPAPPLIVLPNDLMILPPDMMMMLVAHTLPNLIVPILAMLWRRKTGAAIEEVTIKGRDFISAVYKNQQEITIK
jgi:hypothetical protein